MTRSLGLHKPRRSFDQCIEVQSCGHATPCHVWNGNIANTGYGRFGAAGKMWLAHRYAYARAFGGIPEGLSIDHLCRNRRCVNPDHLEAVTLQENTRRQIAHAPQKTGPRCAHPQEPGWANCRVCARARRARYCARLRDAFGSDRVVGGFRAHLGKTRDDTRHQGTDGGASPSAFNLLHLTSNSDGSRQDHG